MMQLTKTMRCIAATTRLLPVVAFLFFPSACSDPKAEAQTHLNQALNLEKAGDDAAALTELKKAVSRAPDFLAARYQLGVVYLRTGALKQGRVELESVRAKGFDDNMVAPPLMRVYLGQGSYREVLDKFDANKYSGDTRADVLATQALALLAIRDTKAAEVSTAHALAEAPKLPSALIAAAVAARLSKNFAVSEKYIDEGIATDPSDLQFVMMKAEARTLAKDYESASKLLDEAVKAHPRHLRIRLTRGLLNVVRNNPDALAEDVPVISKIAPYSQVGKYLNAHNLYYQEHYREAVGELLAVPKLINRYAPAQYLLAAAALGSDQLSLAATYAELYVKNAPTDLLGPELLAAVAIANNDAARAVNILEPLAQAHNDDMKLRLQLASAYHAVGQIDDQARLLEEGAWQDPQNKAASDALNRFRAGNLVRGIRPLHELVQGEPDSLEYYRFVGGQFFGGLK